jgi:hypothetical protein
VVTLGAGACADIDLIASSNPNASTLFLVLSGAIEWITDEVLDGAVTAYGPAVERPNRLVFTWTWEPPDPHAGIGTLVTIELLAAGTGTEVVVTHEWFPTVAARDRHEAGWRATVDRLKRPNSSTHSQYLPLSSSRSGP